VLQAEVGAIIAYLFTEGTLGTGDGHLQSLESAAESRGSTYAFMTSRQLRFNNLTLSCIRLVIIVIE
jgi:hypothetical protein